MRDADRASSVGRPSSTCLPCRCSSRTHSAGLRVVAHKWCRDVERASRERDRAVDLVRVIGHVALRNRAPAAPELRSVAVAIVSPATPAREKQLSAGQRAIAATALTRRFHASAIAR